MARKRKPYWTPERIRELHVVTGLKTQLEFATLLRISPQLLSAWLSGKNVPAGIATLALDCIARLHDYPPSK